MKTAGFLLGLLGALAITAPASAKSSLAGWWPLNENSGTVAHDASHEHDNGRLSGGARWTGGYFGWGLSFDGRTGGVTVPDSLALEPRSAVTVTAFVKASGSPGDYRSIIAKGASGCNAASYSLYTGANGGLAFYISPNGLSFTISPNAGTHVWDGRWHFVVGTYDRHRVHLYVDGKEVGRGTPAAGRIGYGLPDGNKLYIGHYDACGNQDLDFDGVLDEPTVWGRALSPSAVRRTYASFTVLHHMAGRLRSFPGSHDR